MRETRDALKQTLAPLMRLNTLVRVMPATDLARACPTPPAGRVLVTVQGARILPDQVPGLPGRGLPGRHVLWLSREAIADPETLPLVLDAARAATVALYRRQRHPQQSPAPLLHLAYVASDRGRLQVISYSTVTPAPIVSSTPPAPWPRLPGWLEPLRPVVTALLGPTPPPHPTHHPAQSGRFRAPLSGGLGA